MASLKVGDTAPDFQLPDTLGGDFQLSDYRGQNVILYFYPKDDTPGCTIEAQQFTQMYDEFEKHNALVFGISYDDEECHKDFIDKYELQVELLADVDGEVAKLYGCDSEDGYAKRSTFVVDENGKLKAVFLNVKPDGHAKEVLQTLA